MPTVRAHSRSFSGRARSERMSSSRSHTRSEPVPPNGPEPTATFFAPCTSAGAVNGLLPGSVGFWKRTVWPLASSEPSPPQPASARPTRSAKSAAAIHAVFGFGWDVPSTRERLYPSRRRWIKSPLTQAQR